MSTAQYYLLNAPGTTLIGILLGVVCFYLWNFAVDVGKVASSYISVVQKGELWRMVTSSLSHFSLLHIAMNVSSLFSLASLEIEWGTVQYLR